MSSDRRTRRQQAGRVSSGSTGWRSRGHVRRRRAPLGLALPIHVARRNSAMRYSRSRSANSARPMSLSALGVGDVVVDLIEASPVGGLGPARRAAGSLDRCAPGLRLPLRVAPGRRRGTRDRVRRAAARCIESLQVPHDDQDVAPPDRSRVPVARNTPCGRRRRRRRRSGRRRLDESRRRARPTPPRRTTPAHHVRCGARRSLRPDARPARTHRRPPTAPVPLRTARGCRSTQRPRGSPHRWRRSGSLSSTDRRARARSAWARSIGEGYCAAVSPNASAARSSAARSPRT